MLTRRSFIVGAGAATACTSIPNATVFSEDELTLQNLLIEKFECRDGGIHDYLVDQTFSVVNNPQPKVSVTDESIFDFFQKNEHGLPHGLIENFYHSNASRHKLNKNNLRSECVIYVPVEEAPNISSTLEFREEWRKGRESRIRRIEAQDRGEELPELYEPVMRKIHEFSRFGFNATRQVAVGASTYFCGRLCALGELHIAKRIDRKWQIVESKGLWAS